MVQTFLKLRAHIDCVQPDEVISFMQSVADKCDKFIVYRHPKEEAEREHIHALLYATTLSCKVLRDWCHTKLKLEKSNANYSVGETYGKNIKISELTYPPYISYMSKGKYEPIYSKGFPDEEIDAFRQSYRCESTIVNTNRPIEQVEKKSKLTQYQIAKEASIRYLETYGEAELDYRRLAEIITKLLHENRSLAHYHIVANIIQDVQSEYEPDKFWQAVQRRIYI